MSCLMASNQPYFMTLFMVFAVQILMDRGDRTAWTGDSHPAQAASLVAFHNLFDIQQNLNSSINAAGAGFPTYQCYWVLSVMDFYHYTGISTVLSEHEPMVAHLLTSLIKTVLASPNPQSGQPGLGFVGWDDRTGAGFSNSSCVECELDFRMLLLRTVNESARAYVFLLKQSQSV